MPTETSSPTHVLTTAAVRWSIETLGSQQIDPAFIYYLYLRQQWIDETLEQASTSDSTVKDLIRMPGGPTGKPYYRPLRERGDRTGELLASFWLQSNIAGRRDRSRVGTHLRPRHPAGSRSRGREPRGLRRGCLPVTNSEASSTTLTKYACPTDAVEFFLASPLIRRNHVPMRWRSQSSTPLPARITSSVSGSGSMLILAKRPRGSGSSRSHLARSGGSRPTS